MKKNIILLCIGFLLCIVTAFNVRAQYNKTFFSNFVKGYDVSYSIDLIPAGAGNSLVLGTSPSAPILLKLLDFNGNLLLDKAFSYPTDPSAVLTPTKVIQTKNGGYIVVGYYYSNTIANNPFAVAFDANLNFMWCNIYTSNAGVGGFSDNFSRVSIVYAADDPTVEDYVITCSGDLSGTGIPTPTYYDMVINALKIDGTSGLPVWNNKYFIKNRTTTYAGISVIADFPHALTYAYGVGAGGTPAMGKYFIGGSSYQWYVSWTPYGPYKIWGFVMTIDGGGNIVDPYREFSIPQYPGGQDVLWDDDPSEQSFVMSYTMGNTTIGGPNNASVMAISKFDFNLNVKQTMYYWDNYAVENYITSIKKTAANDGYIASCWLAGSAAFTPAATGNISLLKVDKPGTPLIFDRHNIYRSTYDVASIISLLDASGTTENYVFNGTVWQTNSSNRDMRVISTDVTGNTCGVQPIPPSYNSYTINPALYDYDVVPRNGFINIALNIPSVISQITACDPMNNPNYYVAKHKLPTQTNNDISIYPTLLQSDANEVKFDLSSDNATDLTVSVYSIEGKFICEQKFSVQQGANNLSWNIPFSQPGNYIIVAASSNKTLYKRTQISKL